MNLEKWQCKSCGAINKQTDLLHAPSPFLVDDELTACGHCKSCDGFELLCDVPECVERSTCGWPSAAGYRRTCGEHGEFER
jgi:hypothetical protein